jgi:hypothetical protein
MSTDVSGSVFKPPKVNVIPQVTLIARNEDFTIEAQLVLSRSKPPEDDRVDNQSFLDRSNWSSQFSFLWAWNAWLYLVSIR